MSNYFSNLNRSTKDYLFTLSDQFPHFLYEYFDIPEIRRLRFIGYFCGMDVASKKIYNYPHEYSRFDHSFAVACVVWQHTHDKKQTVAAFLHDIASPATSHVIEYKNGDKKTQEESEKRTRSMIENSEELLKQLEKDGLTVDDVVDAKKYSLVDNNVPGLCADRIDSIFMNNVLWTKQLNPKDIKGIYSHIITTENEKGLPEFAVDDFEIGRTLVDLSLNFGYVSTQREDHLCMQLLAEIVDRVQKIGYISEDDLYRLTNPELFEIIEKTKDKRILKLWQTSLNMTRIRRIQTPIVKMPWNYYAYLDGDVKKRWVDPLFVSSDGIVRISEVDNDCSGKKIEEYLAYSDAGWAYTRKRRR